MTLLLLLLLSLGVFSCVTVKPFSFATLYDGNNSGIKQEKFLVIDSKDDYEELMENLKISDEPEKIDFSRFLVIGVFLGEKPTGGYNIRIQRILQKGETLEVHLVKRAPEEGEMVTQALTSPFHVVLSPRPKGREGFKKIDSSHVDFLNMEAD